MSAAPDLATPFAAASTPGLDGRLAVDHHWSGFGGAHGGLMVAAAARAMARVLPDDRPLRSVHADLVGAVAPGELQLSAQLVRAGRSAAFVSAAGEQGGRTRLTASAVFGSSAPGIDYASRTRAVAPGAPPPGEIEPWRVPGGPALATVEFRPVPGSVLPISAAADADLLVWVRIAGDDALLDAARAITLLDAPAPGLFATLSSVIAIPTVEFTAHLMPALARANGPWALARMRTVVAGDGYCVDDCELWNEAGELLATGRQLRRVIAPS